MTFRDLDQEIRDRALADARAEYDRVVPPHADLPEREVPSTYQPYEYVEICVTCGKSYFNGDHGDDGHLFEAEASLERECLILRRERDKARELLAQVTQERDRYKRRLAWKSRG
jgi:hypothetical protein